MKNTNLVSLANLINLAIDDDNPVKMRISNSQYNDAYLHIFLDEIEHNNGKPSYYDSFGARLWERIDKDINQHKELADEFIIIWNSWCDLYRYLKSKDKI